MDDDVAAIARSPSTSHVPSSKIEKGKRDDGVKEVISPGIIALARLGRRGGVAK